MATPTREQVDDLAAKVALYATMSEPEQKHPAKAPPQQKEASKPPAAKKKGAAGKGKPDKKAASAGPPKTVKQGYDRWTLADPESIKYGYLGPTGGAQQAVADGTNHRSFYLTTAINYTNGPAHMGHAYEAATSDAISRYHRLCCSSAYFCTGADEHGQKIATTASEAGKEPIDICNQYATGFQVLNQRLLISNDEYVRTTSDRHKDTARKLWQKCADAGDVYLDKYSGWYNVREETFVTDKEAELADFKDEASGKPLKKVEEESYFFRMSKYQKQLIDHIEGNPKFIQPEKHRKQILARLQQDDLRDLSISRTTFSWGISVPEGFNADHVMYVWVDALSNYLTGIDYFGSQGRDGLDQFWPANVHIIGKDILWFHTVIWPCLLFSAGIPLPHQVFAHGFVNDKEGKKMSKSLGNVVDPHDMLDKYTVDTFRWYLCKEAPYGGELAFSEDSLGDMHNSDLCDTLGNLVHRATNLCQKYCGGTVPDVAPKAPLKLTEVIQSYTAKMDELDLQGGANVAIAAFRDVNGYLQDEAPWLKKGDEHAEARQVTVRTCLEAIYVLSHLLLPFMPSVARIFEKLGTPPSPNLTDLKVAEPNLSVGTKIVVGDVLFTKILSEAELAAKNDDKGGKGGKKESHAEAQARKKAEKAKQIAKSKSGKGEAVDPNQPDFTKMEIRVGRIGKVWNHPEADKLFCEEIDVGEESGPREIASGLREHYSLDDMKDKLVLVVCNMKASKMLGFMSNGMVLAAKTSDKVELVEAPEGSKIGERVQIAGLTGEPVTAAQVKKRKVWDSVTKDLKTGAGGVAMWKDKAIVTSAGECKAATLEGAPIA